VRGSKITDVVARLRGPAADVEAAAPERWQQVLGFRLGSAVDRSLRYLPLDARCLARSLVLTRLLAVRGIPHSLLIGVRGGPDFLAHAWVESGGLALLPREEEFAPLVKL
jgi:hypothetical protein